MTWILIIVFISVSAHGWCSSTTRKPAGPWRRPPWTLSTPCARTQARAPPRVGRGTVGIWTVMNWKNLRNIQSSSSSKWIGNTSDQSQRRWHIVQMVLPFLGYRYVVQLSFSIWGSVWKQWILMKLRAIIRVFIQHRFSCMWVYPLSLVRTTKMTEFWPFFRYIINLSKN